jgi:hypothetical protein
MLLSRNTRRLVVPLVLCAACLLVAAGFLVRHAILRARADETGLTPIVSPYKSVTAENVLVSYVGYDSVQAALDATPLIALGEIVEVIQPFDRLIDKASGSPEQKIADKLGSEAATVVRISAYRVRIIESIKGTFSTTDIIVCYNADVFDQLLPLDAGQQLIWTLAESPQPVGSEFGGETVYTFITPGLSAFYLTPDQQLVPVCREANGSLLDKLSLLKLRALSGG